MGLRSLVVKRIFIAIPLILCVLMFDFIIIHLVPGDPAFFLAGGALEEERVVQHRMKIINEQLGLDKPLPEQLLIYFSNMLRGDFGYSFVYQRPVFEVIMERMPYTLLLLGSATAIGIPVGIILGVEVAKRPNGKLDKITSFFSFILYSTPIFWVAMMLILIFALHLHWLPAAGYRTMRVDLTGIDFIIDVIRHMILPVFLLGGTTSISYCRLVRISVLEASQQDYIITARSKGASESIVFYKHALRNGLIPVATVIFPHILYMIQGNVFIETVFGWPGVGKIMFDAIGVRDYPMLMGSFTIMAVTVILANLAADVSYYLLDPRIRYNSGK